MITFSEWVINEVVGKKIDIGDVTLQLVKDEEWNEYIVKWIENGVFDDNKSYHTDDLDDAVTTMQDMANREELRQKNPIVRTGPGGDATTDLTDI